MGRRSGHASDRSGRAGRPAAGHGPATPTEVVSCFLRHRGEVLLVRRSARVGSYRGRWGAISGHVETDDPLRDAWREIEEETGLQDAASLARRGEPFAFDDAAAGRSWRVHPFAFDVSRRDAALDWEAVEGAWLPPTAILERDCVPRLWTSYVRAGPTLEQIRSDRRHGSSYLSLRALEALRDSAAALAAGVEAPGVDGGGRAGRSGGVRAELLELARALALAQPAMTAVGTRVDRAVTAGLAAAENGTSPKRTAAGGEAREPLALALRDAAQAALAAALAAEDGAVAEGARAVADRTVLTLSLSGTVIEALLASRPAPRRVVVCESQPGGEGAALAERLAAQGLDALLVPDAAVAWALERERVELVLVGADTVLPDGSVINKVGTHPAALAAGEAGVPVLVVAASDKVAAEGWEVGAGAEGELDGWRAPADAADGGRRRRAASGPGEEAARVDEGRSGEAWRRGDAARRRAPLFERTPAKLVGGVLCERGRLAAADVRAVAVEHAGLRRWRR